MLAEEAIRDVMHRYSMTPTPKRLLCFREFERIINKEKHMGINEIIADIIKTTVQNELALRMHAFEERQRRDTEALLTRINELAADIGRWKGQQLALPEQRFKEIFDQLEVLEHGSPTNAAFVALGKEVDRLRRHVEALDHAKAKDDERFQDDVASVLDQDNMDAKIREVVKDVLEDDDFLAERLADVFNKGAMTISVDKV